MNRIHRGQQRKDTTNICDRLGVTKKKQKVK